MGRKRSYVTVSLCVLARTESVRADMSDELEQMILRYLADMADRGDYEAKKLFDLISHKMDDGDAYACNDGGATWSITHG